MQSPLRREFATKSSTRATAVIRLVALDLDQTLMGADLVVSDRVKAAMGAAAAKGALLTIATGREASLAARFARDLGMTTPVICAQGACIYDVVKAGPLREVRLSRELLPRMVSAGEEHGWNFHFESSEGLFFPSKSNHPPEFFELLRYSNWVRVGDLLRDMPHPPHKLIVTLNRPENKELVIGQMADALGGDCEIVASHPYLIEALPTRVNKGSGLAWLAHYLGISRHEVMAVGDSDADIPMLAWAGVGVAMGNGSPAAKAAADWVAPSMAEDGAAVALEKYVTE